MQNEDSQKIWSEFYARKKENRLAEAVVLWDLLQKAGATDETDLALDFVHFGSSQTNIENLAKQLSENYEMKVEASPEVGYWFANGTSRPYGINLTKKQHLGWVEFMADVAESYGCVFSKWSLEAPSLKQSFSSDSIEIE